MSKKPAVAGVLSVVSLATGDSHSSVDTVAEACSILWPLFTSVSSLCSKPFALELVRYRSVIQVSRWSEQKFNNTFKILFSTSSPVGHLVFVNGVLSPLV